MDLFAKVGSSRGPLGELAKQAVDEMQSGSEDGGYIDLLDGARANLGAADDVAAQLVDKARGIFAFPKLEGEIGNRMTHCGQECIVWSLNNYLGLANDPEIRAVDAEAAREHGLATPMGARMMSGETWHHEALERDLAAYSAKEDALFLNYGYQGMVSALDALTTRHDWIFYDAEAHACIIDGIRLHPGRHLAFRHNDVEHLAALLERSMAQGSPAAGRLVVTEGVFGMSGEQGRLREIVELKKRYDFRLLVDDAHGFGIMGADGGGTGEEQGVQDEVDLYFGTFAKAGASIGAFIAGPAEVVSYLRYTMRSQMFSKGLPLPILIGNRKRLQLIRERPDARSKMWEVARALQGGLRDAGFDLGATDTPITPVYLSLDLARAGAFVLLLREQHCVFCSPVVYPVVPRGVLMLRLIPTCEHTDEDVATTVEAFSEAHRAVGGAGAGVREVVA